MIRLNRVLVPTDFSEHSKSAVRYGCELASKFGADLHLLHVVEQLPVMYSEGAIFTPETEAELLAEATNLLDRTPEDIDVTSLKVTRATLQGHPLVEITRYAKENEIDLIVIGTHGRTGLVHMLLGSVAEKVVRKAPCPVLTVHHPEHEFVKP